MRTCGRLYESLGIKGTFLARSNVRKCLGIFGGHVLSRMDPDSSPIVS